MSIDNPAYFYNNEHSPKTPDSPNRKFFFFRRRSSSNKLIGSPSKSRSSTPTTSLNLDLPPIGNHGNQSTKGSFRSLLRSKSTNSGCIYSQIVQPGGEGHFNSTISQDTVDNTSACKYRERLGSYNETISYGMNDDVFYRTSSCKSQCNGVPDTKTLNSADSQPATGLRRHSIGTFRGNVRLRSTSFSDEVPKMPAPKIPSMSPTPKRGDNMDDILVITTKQSEHGTIWFNHLKACFDNITKQRGRLPFNFLHIKIDDGPISSELSYRSKQTKLQIVIICPVLISLPGAYLKSQLTELIKPSIALGMFLDVSDEKITELHKNIFPSFYKWKRVVVRSSDQSPLSELVGTAVDILGRALREQPLCTEVETPNQQKGSHHDHFTVLPRKVRTGHNKIVALLSEPLTSDDCYKVKIEKMGDILEIQNVKKRNPYTLQITVPECCLEISTMIGIRIEKNGIDLGSKPVKCESRLREMEQILKGQDSPVKFMCHSLGLDANADIEKLDLYLVQSFQKNVPPNFDLVAAVQDKPNFFSYKEARPEEYPTLLHFAAKYGLERLCLQLVEFPGGIIACDLRNASGKTPEEIAEDEKHHKIASYLKYFSQMHRITTMYDYVAGITDKTSTNKSSKIEEKIEKPQNTDKSNNKKEENTMQMNTPEYMQMNGSGSDTSETTNIPKNILNNAVTNLNYIKIQTNNSSKENSGDEFEIMTNELKITEPNYFQSNDINYKSDELSSLCSKVLENFESDYLTQPSNIPVNYSNVTKTQNNGFGDYLTHPSNKPIDSLSTTAPDMSNYVIQPSNREVQTSDLNELDKKLNFHRIDKSFVMNNKLKSNSLKRHGSDISKTSVDDELLEIINDFKNNVFTIQEVEQLVASWKNRNDVQQSFKDKQEQLQKMREEYDRIQSQMKEKLKRPTPFERMKKMFSFNKPSHNKDLSKGESNNNINSPKSNHRPMSSLSLHSVSSSSSSGRMSTGSACSGASLGDSGTHSDHEDRRHVFSSICRVGLPGSLMENYMVPPAPRPIHTPVSTPTPNEEKERIIFPNRSTTPNTNSEHYIIFPSNMPVENSQTHHDYMNFPSLNTIIEQPNEICVTLQPIKIPKNEIIYTASNKHLDNLCTSFKTKNLNGNINFNDNFEQPKLMSKNLNLNNTNNNVNNSDN